MIGSFYGKELSKLKMSHYPEPDTHIRNKLKGD